MGIADIVLIVFIVLKLLGLVKCSWWMIFLPYIGLTIVLVFIIKIFDLES